MRLLELPDDVLDLLAGGTLSEGHGRALLLAVRARTSARAWPAPPSAAAGRCASARPPPSAPPSPRSGAKADGGVMDDELAHLAVDAAWQSLGLRASVRRGPRGGRVELHFSSAAELGRIVDQLRADRVSWAD